MGIDAPDARNVRSGKPQKRVLHLDGLLRHDAIVIFHEQVKVLPDDPRGGILNRQDGIIRLPVPDALHGVPPGLYMEPFRLFPEISLHGQLAVCALRPLIHKLVRPKRQLVHLGKPKLRSLPILVHELVLAFPAKRHDLPEQLPGAVPVLF